MSKEDLKQKAIKLRREGQTYSEILDVIPVAKSTLSLWLREVCLSKKQTQKITQKRIDGQKRGAQAQKNKRVNKQKEIIESAQYDIKSISNRELWLIGIALYWAEGSKSKEHNTSVGISFSNSDPNMIYIFIEWLRRCLGIDDKDIITSLYIHELHKHRTKDILDIWGKKINKPLSFFKYVYYKKNKIKTNRKNTGDLYIGLLRVNIKASSDLNRKITGWIKGICSNCGLV